MVSFRNGMVFATTPGPGSEERGKAQMRDNVREGLIFWPATELLGLSRVAPSAVYSNKETE